MIFDQSWLSDLLELQKKASELTQNKNSTDEIQSLVKTVLSQWGVSGFPWEENFQFPGGFQKNEPFEAQNNSHLNIDISEKKIFVQIQILLPGIKAPDDLQIKLSGNTLILMPQ